MNSHGDYFEQDASWPDANEKAKNKVDSDKQKAQSDQGASNSASFSPDPDDDHDPKEEVRKLIESKLKDHENGSHKGHTIRDHIGKDEQYLARRIRDEGKSEVTSFKDYETAEKCKDAIIESKAKKIIKWLEKMETEKDMVFSTDFDDVVGYGLKKGENILTPKKKAMILLRKTADGVKIITSHPL